MGQDSVSPLGLTAFSGVQGWAELNSFFCTSFQGVFTFLQLNKNIKYLKESRRKQALVRQPINPATLTKGKGNGEQGAR